MKIIKFGGSSVADAERIENIINIIQKDAKNIRGVVCSAFGGTTDDLIKTAKLAQSQDDSFFDEYENIKKRHLDTIKKLRVYDEKLLKLIDKDLSELKDVLEGVYLLKELSKRSLDFIMSFGERLSNKIICHKLKDVGVRSDFLDSRPLIKTDDNFGSALVDMKTSYKNIKEYFSEHNNIQIITGFIGSTSENVTTTLGRGGSDYTASLFSAALEVDSLEIWSDVDGVMSADPRKVDTAFSIEEMTYEEAMEMSHFGAKVIYAPTMQPVKKRDIPIKIKNTYNPEFEGTIIKSEVDSDGKAIRGITAISQVSLLTLSGSGMVGIPGFAARLFEALARKKINVILITQASSEHTISFAIMPEDEKKAQEIIEQEFKREMNNQLLDEVKVESNLSIVAVVGESMKNTPGIAAKLFSALGDSGINISAIAQGSSELNISTVIKSYQKDKALKVIHHSFFDIYKTLNIYLAGNGLIGSELIKQIKANEKDLLYSHRKIIIRSVCSSSKIDKNVKDNTPKLDEKYQKKEFIEKILNDNLENKVFVDCTASDSYTEEYPRLLSSSVSVVTPNKKANSSSLNLYNKIKNSWGYNGAKYLYETNVGAGLPIISTLQDMIKTGDEIYQIEGVFSGTLSYIFNNFTSEDKFSDIVKVAKENGYTEPDPRDDLNGMDVARKALILAREMGIYAELNDINIESLMSEAQEKANSIDEFMQLLPNGDQSKNKLIKEATKENKVIRYVASIHKDRDINIGLQKYKKDHPISNLNGSENIAIIKSKRYNNYPLVIKGPGAGASVTAAGVYGDILKTI